MNDTAEMPRYQCHKIVHALKIKKIRFENGIQFEFVNTGYAPIKIEYSEAARFKQALSSELDSTNPDTGYLVVYEDGYRSWSPTKAFEDGYTRL